MSGNKTETPTAIRCTSVHVVDTKSGRTIKVNSSLFSTGVVYPVRAFDGFGFIVEDNFGNPKFIGSQRHFIVDRCNGYPIRAYFEDVEVSDEAGI